MRPRNANSKPQTQFPLFLRALIPGLGIVVVAVLLWNSLCKQNEKQMQQRVSREAENLKASISAQLKPQVLALQRMARRWEVAGKTSKRVWEEDAKNYLAHEPGAQALEWVDNSFHVRWIVPFKGNEQAKDLNLAFEKRRKVALEKARDSHRETVTDPIDLVQGGRGFLVYEPIYIHKKFDGFMLGVFRYDSFLEGVLKKNPTIGRNYSASVVVAGGEVFRNEIDESLNNADWAKVQTVKLYDSEWKIKVWPSSRFVKESKSALPTAALAMGLVLACLISLITYLYLKSSQRAIALEQAIKQRKLLEAKLVHSYSLAALGEMAASVAHEINNPLMIIQGNCELLALQSEKSKTNTKEMDETFQTINQTVRRISEIITGLRQFANVEDNGEFKTSAVRDIISSPLNLIKEQFSDLGIDIRTDEIPESLKIECNLSRISQVILNLIHNSRDAVGLLSEKWINIDVFDEGSTVLIAVTDSGKGIPKEHQYRMLEPFYTTKEVNEGSGLGLSISKGIIENHNGTLELDTISKNTRFVIRLPKHQPNPPEKDSVDIGKTTNRRAQSHFSEF